MNCTTIVKTASSSAAYLHLNAFWAAKRYFRNFDHSDGFLTNHVGCSAEQQPTQRSLLERLPYEVLDMIVQVMDLKSFWAFASVNRQLRASICSLQVIRDTQKSFAVSYALRRLIKADTGNTFTITDFEATLRSKTCTHCKRDKEFAPFLNLATCQRICFVCQLFECVHPSKLARLPYLDTSGNTFRVNDGMMCEGCTTDARDSGSRARVKLRRAYLEDQFLEHFNKCETAWEIAAGQRMTAHDEWRSCQKLRLGVEKVWGSERSRQTPPASSICAAICDLEYAGLTPEAFKAECERLERILRGAKAQKMMEIESRKKGQKCCRKRRSKGWRLTFASLRKRI